MTLNLSLESKKKHTRHTARRYPGGCCGKCQRRACTKTLPDASCPKYAGRLQAPQPSASMMDASNDGERDGKAPSLSGWRKDMRRATRPSRGLLQRQLLTRSRNAAGGPSRHDLTHTVELGSARRVWDGALRARLRRRRTSTRGAQGGSRQRP